MLEHEGRFSARRGPYRIIYELVEDERIVRWSPSDIAATSTAPAHNNCDECRNDLTSGVMACSPGPAVVGACMALPDSDDYRQALSIGDSRHL